MSHDVDQMPARFREALAPVYRVERLLGVGGMATVYLAHDVRHERQVAIKIMRDELSATVGASRFLREIRMVARLTHPNILPLLDSGAIDDTPYYVMPFIDGESLRARLERLHVLPLTDALAFTAEVADALNYAHAAGIVHCDIKPENILLLGHHAVVADFGIARGITNSSSEDRMTTGVIIGTPAYMSPEQAAGDESIDGRSDIYSLATVLYEMVSGAVPFSAKTAQALIARRFMHAAPRLSSKVPGIPPHIDDALAAALSLEPGDRPETATQFARLLAGQQGRPQIGETPPLPARPTAAMPFAVTASDPQMLSIAVLPFANMSSDPENEFISDGITEEIMSALSRLRTIRVAARTSSFAFKGKHEDVRVIGRKLGVSSVLDGSVFRAGSRVRVSAQLVDATTGFEVWSDRLDRHFDDVFAIQSDVARAISGALGATLFGPTQSAQASAVTGTVYETYLRGRYALNKRSESGLQKAVECFTRATEQDAEFALAHAGLADALLMLGVYGARRPREVMPLSRAAAERALSIDPSLPEAHTTLGAVRALYDWDWEGAEDAFRRAIALGPRYSTAFQWLAVNHLIPRGRFDEARPAIERAQSLEPMSMVVALSVGVVQHLCGDPAGAVGVFRRALELDSAFAMSHYFLGGAMRDAGDLAGSAVAFRTAIAQSGGTPEMNAGLAQTLARQGDAYGARALLRDLVTAAEQRYVSPCLLAQIHVALGETDRAMSELERAHAEHDPELVFIGVRQTYAPLRELGPFIALRESIGV